MKNQLILSMAFLLLSASSLFGQLLDNGNFIIGGTVGFSAAESKVTYSLNSAEEEGESPSALQINFAPKIGYFLMDNLALGIGLDYTYSKLKEPNTDRTKSSDLLFGPFSRYYFPVGQDMAFFMEVGFGFGNSSNVQDLDIGRQSVNTNVFAVGIGPGFTILSSSDIGIEALFKYNFARSQFNTENSGVKTITTTKTSQFDIAIGLQFYFGGINRIGGG